MKTNWIKKTLSLVLAGAMVVCLATAADKPAEIYAEESKDGKYVSDVYIAYGKTEDEAKKWLEDNGWEPVEGDLNAGKASFFDDNKLQDQNVAAVMGIHRTDEKASAVTDMAVMNMKGGYDIPQYEELVAQKRQDIDEFINSFLPVLKEYRDNYLGRGGASGKARANFIHQLLNHFYDGRKNDPYAKNDTELYIGDGLLEPIRQEGNDRGIDLEQVLLESTGPAVYALEVALALATDLSEDSWLDRAGGLTGDDMYENLPKYVPEAEGLDIAPSAVGQFLGQKYGKSAQILAEQWGDINEKMIWYENYNSEHDLWQHDDESEDAYADRVVKTFDELKKTNPEAYDEEYDKYGDCAALYYELYEIPYRGDWGESLGDFFNPADEAYKNPEDDSFLPMAAAMSPGQRAALNLVSLSSMIMIGVQNEKVIEKIAPDIEEILGGEEAISIYSGMNRAIFRKGVALTSNASMEMSRGYDPFADIISFSGYYNTICYSAIIAAIPVIGLGVRMIEVNPIDNKLISRLDRNGRSLFAHKRSIDDLNIYKQKVEQGTREWGDLYTEESWQKEFTEDTEKVKSLEEQIAKDEGEAAGTASARLTGKIIIGIGAALMIGAAVAKAVQVYKYYEKDFTPIPSMIVDEADIVTYIKDKDGNETKKIDFDQFVYYQAVRCNRQEVGEIGDWQDGVEEYENLGCGDIADINCDMGQQWLALYTVRSSRKGDPILADTLTVQYGSKEMPEKCSKGLHLFTYTNVMDLGDTAYCFNNAKKGIYLFWGEDKDAFAATEASAFGAGHLALAGIGGLIPGIAGATLVLTKKRRKDEPEAA